MMYGPININLNIRLLQAEAQVALQPATRALLKPSHSKSPTHKELRTRRPIW